jgi:hypothetical protein
MNRLIKRIIFVFLSLSLLILLIWKADLKTGMMNNTGTWTVGVMVLEEGEDEFDIVDKLNSNLFFKIPTKSANTGDSIYFLADPFLYRHKDTTYLFVETASYERSREGKGAYICTYRISDDLKEIEYLGIALKEPFHLSYPQVIEVGKEIFLIPETQGGDSSFVYRSKSFPLEWEKSDYLLPQQIKDPTLVPKDKISGDFYYTKDGLLLRRSYIYENDNFKIGEREYVKTGTAFRPGGSPFYADGKHYLPIQDNSHGYGTNLSIRELTQSGELKKGSVEYLLTPSSNNPEFEAGMHHISSIQIDGKKIVAFDGINLLSDKRSLNFKFLIKYNYLNIWDWIFGSNLEPWYPFNE